MRTVKKVMAYIFMPLLFLALDVSVSYILFQPLIEDVKGYANLLLLDDVPDFAQNNDEIEKVLAEYNTTSLTVLHKQHPQVWEDLWNEVRSQTMAIRMHG